MCNANQWCLWTHSTEPAAILIQVCGPITHPPQSCSYTSDFLLAIMMQFFWELSCHQHAVVATLGDKFWQNPWFCCKKFNSLIFFAISCCDFFSCCITCVRVAIHAIFAACWRRENFQKNRTTIANKKLPVQLWLNQNERLGARLASALLFTEWCVAGHMSNRYWYTELWDFLTWSSVICIYSTRK